MKGDGKTRLKGDGSMRVPCHGGPYDKNYLRVNPDHPEVGVISFPNGEYQLHENDSRYSYTWKRTLDTTEVSE